MEDLVKLTEDLVLAIVSNKEAEQKIATTAPIIPKIPTNCLIIIFSLS